MESKGSFDLYLMQMRCGKESKNFILYAEQVRLEEGLERTYDPSRTRFSTDFVRVVSGKLFQSALHPTVPLDDGS